jgi:hypothetical protein
MVKSAAAAGNERRIPEDGFTGESASRPAGSNASQPGKEERQSMQKLQ